MPGLCLRERTRATARHTYMLPSRFAMNVGHRTVVCKALDRMLGEDIVEPSPRVSSMLRGEASAIDVLPKHLKAWPYEIHVSR